MLGVEGAELEAAYLGEYWGEPAGAKASRVYRNYRNPWGVTGGGGLWSHLTNGEMLSGRKQREGGGGKCSPPNQSSLRGSPGAGAVGMGAVAGGTAVPDWRC